MISTSYIVTALLLVCLTYPGNSMKLEPRIIGGVEIWNRCQAPYNWMVALQMNSRHGPVTFCSAVMWDNTTLITSGRCIYQFINDQSIPGVAVVGQRDLLSMDREEQTIPIAGLRVHPQYKPGTYENNIGLVRLAYPARLGPCVKPAQRMEKDPKACTDIDTSCVMAGWGPYADTSQPTNSRIARSAALSVYGDFVTQQLELARMKRNPPKGSVYAEAINPRQKACFFDWGGVVACIRNGHYVLRGVIGDYNCNVNANPPIMVTNVPDFMQWIDACQRNWNSVTCAGQVQRPTQQ